MSVSTLETRSAIAPPARRERAETSDGRKPKSVPRKVTASRRVEVMREGGTLRVLQRVPVWT